MPTTEALTNWHATNWAELSELWTELVGPPGTDSQAHGPVFRTEQITAQQAGFVFQRWILEAFWLSGARVEGPIRVPLTHSDATKEELDGVVYEAWAGFLVESKLWEARLGFGSIARLHVLTERRPAGTLGLLFAPVGFTMPAIESAQELRPIRVLLFDRFDLDHAVRKSNLMEIVRVKWAEAVKYGRPNAPIPGSERL